MLNANERAGEDIVVKVVGWLVGKSWSFLPWSCVLLPLCCVDLFYSSSLVLRLLV